MMSYKVKSKIKAMKVRVVPYAQLLLCKHDTQIYLQNLV